MPSACVKKSQISRVFIFFLISLIFLWIPTSAFTKAILHIKEPTVTETEPKEEELTREKTSKLIYAANFVKDKVGEFLSWTIGYDITKITRAKLVPIIYYVRAIPRRVLPVDSTVVDIEASVDDPAGLENISAVRADLSRIGKLANSSLVDNGLWGDLVSGDGIYTLQTSISPEVPKGPKEIPVAALNKNGWLALSKTVLDVEKSPIIVETTATPSEVPPDGRTIVTLTVKIDNPGGSEEIKIVTVDLTEIGGGSDIPMWNNGSNGDVKAGDDIFTVQTIVQKGISRGVKKLKIDIVNLLGGRGRGEIILSVK